MKFMKFYKGFLKTNIFSVVLGVGDAGQMRGVLGMDIHKEIPKPTS